MAKTFTKLVSLVAYDATLTERTDDFYLRAKTMPDTVSLRDIAAEVATRLNRNEDEIFAVLNDAERVKADAVASSYIVSTPTALMRPCAGGTVLKSDLSQAIDRKKVKVYATLSMGPLLRTEMEGCRVELFTQPAVVGPLLNGAVAQTRAADGTVSTRAPQAGKNIRLTVHLGGNAFEEGVRPPGRCDGERAEAAYFRPPRRGYRRVVACEDLYPVWQRRSQCGEPACL